jgi:hypothetical protein
LIFLFVKEVLVIVADAQASFLDSSGRTFTSELTAVRADAVAAGRPWRVFRWRRGQAHYSGWYWSATAGGHVVYESRLEPGSRQSRVGAGQ